jgi:hypothetical protein
MASQETQLAFPVEQDTSSDDGDVNLPPVQATPSRRLSSAVETALRQSILGDPNRMLLSLATETASERRKSAVVWMRDQRNRGRLLEVTERDEPACLRWIEDHWVCILREAFRELESLRSYRASADADIRRAVDWINAAALERFSRN